MVDRDKRHGNVALNILETLILKLDMVICSLVFDNKIYLKK